MCQTYNVHLTLKSANAKTGPIPVSTSSRTTCPNSCPLKARGCYASGGPLAIHWTAVTNGERGTDWQTFCDSIANLPEGQVWRHNQAGDLPSDGETIDLAALRALYLANLNRLGFTYSHHDVESNLHNREAIREANDAGFTVNLSANDLDHADRLAALNIGPVAVVLPADATANTTTPEGRRVVVCPAAIREGVSCATCKLCSRADRRAIIGLPAHGSQKKAADAIARGSNVQ